MSAVLTKEMLNAFTQELRNRYVAHEITADQFSTAMEDIKLCQRRAS